MSLISFADFTFSYSEDLPPALREIDLTIDEGETVVVCGPSGSGKTTLCLAAANLLDSFPAGVRSGAVYGVHPDPGGKHPTAVVMQNFYAQVTYLRSTVFEEIGFPCENLGLPRGEIIARVEEAMEKIRIGQLARRNPLELSGGEKQKVVLAAAIATKPSLLILDEPLSQLDSETTSYLSDVILELKRTSAILIAENDPYLMLKVADRVVVLSDGKILAGGRLPEILNPDTARIVELPAWTKCVKSAEEKGLVQTGPGAAYESLDYGRALRRLRSIS